MSDYPNSGIILKNKWARPATPGRKAPPDAKGECNVTCKHCQQETRFEIVGWIDKVRHFTKLRFNEWEAAEKRKLEAQAKRSGLPMEGSQPIAPPAEQPTDAPQPEASTPPTEPQTAENQEGGFAY